MGESASQGLGLRVGVNSGCLVSRERGGSISENCHDFSALRSRELGNAALSGMVCLVAMTCLSLSKCFLPWEIGSMKETSPLFTDGDRPGATATL